MKPSRALLTLPLAIAALYPPAGPVHAQSQTQQQPQSGPRGEARKHPDPASNPNRTTPGNGGANTSAQTPSDPATPAASPGERSPQPMRGQDTVEGSRANPAADGKIPGGKAGSGGHKTNEFGR
ncbi:hypothetical protein D9M72_82020 [compost metagenome]